MTSPLPPLLQRDGVCDSVWHPTMMSSPLSASLSVNFIMISRLSGDAHLLHGLPKNGTYYAQVYAGAGGPVGIPGSRKEQSFNLNLETTCRDLRAHIKLIKHCGNTENISI